MNKSSKIPSNKELEIEALKHAIEELTGIYRNPTLGVNKKRKDKKGIRIWSDKSTICPSEKVENRKAGDKESTKRCERDSLLCPYYHGVITCQNSPVSVKRRDRNNPTLVEMYMMSLKRIKTTFQQLDSADFHKTPKARAKLRSIVMEINNSVHDEFKLKRLI